MLKPPGETASTKIEVYAVLKSIVYLCLPTKSRQITNSALPGEQIGVIETITAESGIYKR